MSTAPSGLQFDHSLDVAHLSGGATGGGTSPSGFKFPNIDFSKIDPNTLAAIAQGAGALYKPSASSSTQVPPQSAFTPEMLDAAFADIQGYLKNQESVYAAGSYAPGVNVTQTSKRTPQDLKKEAFIKFRMGKGDTLDQATQAANRIIADPNVNFKSKAGFIKAVNNGEAANLSIGPDGKLVAADTYTPGGVTQSSESDMLKSYLNQLNSQSFQATNGLPQAYRNAENQNLSAQAGLRGSIMNQTTGFNQQGLLPQEQANLDATNNYFTRQYGNLFAKSVNQAQGSLINSGFTSSSLADDVMYDTAYKPLAEYASDSAAKMAAQYNDILNSRASRQNTALTGTMNAYKTMAPAGMNQFFGPNTSGSDFGLFTDPQAAVLANQIQQQNIANRQKDQGLYQNVYMAPVSMMPTAPGGNGQPGSSGGSISGAATGALSGAATGAEIGSIIPRVGTLIGAGVGALIGGYGGYKK